MHLLIDNPLVYNYHPFFNLALDSHPYYLEVYINHPINHVEHLDIILNHLYHEIRMLALQKKFDYRFEITVLFNVQPQHPVVIVESERHLSLTNADKFIDIQIAKADLQLPHTSFPQFDVCAVGGTFDHIHDGHKILLSVAVFLAKKKLIVGVTGPGLLKGKKYAEYLDPFEKRLKSVVKFFARLAHGQLLETYKINDVCGPTGFVKEIDCLVLSGETASGGEYVNNFRKQRDYPILDVYAIHLINAENPDVKLSSTDLRRADYEEYHKNLSLAST